jgi:diguanylate cyclase (GGDEF)-like protein
MVYSNTFSIVFYCVMFLFIRNEWMNAFAIAVYLEVAIHMAGAAVCLGWECGFQVALIGMNVLAFYAEYLGRRLLAKHVSGLALGIVGLVLYIASFLITHLLPSPYRLPPNIEFVLQITWAIIVFGVMISFLQVFVFLAANSERELSSQLTHDKLTKLPNRYFMAKHLAKLTKEKDVDQYWIAMADIDNFKHVNDTYGHNCGDYVLQTVAQILMEGKDKHAELCRWGGEEFLIAGKAVQSFPYSCGQLNLMRSAVESYAFWYEGNKLSITITIGVAQYNEKYNLRDWINAADELLYEGKCNGKNRVIW